MRLWSATALLVEWNRATWTLHYDNCPDPEERQHSARASVLELEEDSQSFQVIQAQVYDAIERHCAKLVKAVMAEIERRLVARRQCSRFTSFLASIIFLNCVERMSLLFRGFDADRAGSVGTTSRASQTPQSEESRIEEELFGIDEPEGEAAEPPRVWPFDTNPRDYWSQYRGVLNLLGVMLELRDLLPKTFADDETEIIKGVTGVAPETKASAEKTAEMVEQARVMAEWLKEANVTKSQLQKAKWTQDTIPTSSTRDWDLRLIAELVLPKQKVATPSRTGLSLPGSNVSLAPKRRQQKKRKVGNATQDSYASMQNQFRTKGPRFS